MFRIFLREILIFILALAVFPVAIIIVVLYKDPLGLGSALLPSEIFMAGMVRSETSFGVWATLLSPYMVLQTIRGFLWSQRSLVGRRWANLYFSVLAAAWAARSMWGAWDLFYFMYTLGDIPAELRQFFRLEAIDLLTAVACAVIAIYCFSIFIDPQQRQRRAGSQAEDAGG